MDPTDPIVKPELVTELLKSVSKPEDMFGPGGVFQKLRAALMERMLEAEMSAHLGFERNAVKGYKSGNTRNGHSPKRVLTESGPVEHHAETRSEGELHSKSDKLTSGAERAQSPRPLVTSRLGALDSRLSTLDLSSRLGALDSRSRPLGWARPDD